MKKILLIILLFAGLITKAQYPNTITGGNSSTLNKQLGGYGASLGFVFTSYFSDTTAANLLFIKNVPGHVIRVVNDLWMRNTDANRWVKIGSSGIGTDNTNLGSFYRLLVPSSQGIKGIAPGYGTMWDSTTNANSLTSKFDSATVFPQLRATVPLRRFGVSGEDIEAAANRTFNFKRNYSFIFD